MFHSDMMEIQKNEVVDYRENEAVEYGLEWDYHNLPRYSPVI